MLPRLVGSANSDRKRPDRSPHSTRAATSRLAPSHPHDDERAVVVAGPDQRQSRAPLESGCHTAGRTSRALARTRHMMYIDELSQALTYLDPVHGVEEILALRVNPYPEFFTFRSQPIFQLRRAFTR